MSLAWGLSTLYAAVTASLLGLDSSHPSFWQLAAFRLLGPRSGEVVLIGLLFH